MRDWAGHENLALFARDEEFAHRCRLQHWPERGDLHKDYFVHESSYVDEPCVIGPGTKIWHFSHVMKNSRIGAGCNIGQNVVIYIKTISCTNRATSMNHA